MDVAGQDHITNTLKNALQQDQVAHAFLFTGPRGVGKTTCARILARVLNCNNPTKDWEPCNSCEMCIAFQENASFNIFELDAASNNGVEHIRSLVEQVRYQPQYGKYKIYIIDEVHMLSSAAFNAFLKTLEEPPPFAKFILATTEKHKILPTILSRCQVYDFRRIKEKDIVLNLEKIAKQENITTENEALYLIAQKADGGMRDALSIFDRITSYSGSKLSYADAVANLNILDQDYFFKFIDAFLLEDITTSFLLFDQVLQAGFDTEIFLEGLGSHIRNLMVCKHPKMQELFEGSEAWKIKYIQQSEACSLSLLMTSLDLINEAEINLIRAKNKRLHLEVLLSKLSYLQRRKTNTSSAPESNPEKKNPELTKVANITANADPAPKQNTTINTDPPKTSVIIDLKEESTKFENIKAEASKVRATNQENLLTKLPVFSSVKEKVKIDEQAKLDSLLELNSDTIQQFWKELMDQQKSNSLRMFMAQAEIELDKKNIHIKVGSAMAREAIRMDLKLDDKLRSTFREDDLIAVIELDPILSEREEKSQTKKLYSAKEKWDIMIAVNPSLLDFKDKLELSIDEF